MSSSSSSNFSNFKRPAMTLLLLLLALALFSTNVVSAESASEKEPWKPPTSTGRRAPEGLEKTIVFPEKFLGGFSTSPSSSSSSSSSTTTNEKASTASTASTATLRKKKQQQKQKQHRSLASSDYLYCVTPDEVYYTADFNLDMLYDPIDGPCSLTELDGIRDFLDYHFDQFTIHNQVLGPIDMVPNGPSCAAVGTGTAAPPVNTTATAASATIRRRRTAATKRRSSRKRGLQQTETVAVTPNGNQQQQRRGPASARKTLVQSPASGDGQQELEQQQQQQQEEEENDNTQNHRSLFTGIFGYFWVGGGNCFFCGYDNGDGRRNLLQTTTETTTETTSNQHHRRLENDSPVTIVIQTDSYPAEMAYKIRTGGVTIFSYTAFQIKNQEYEQTVHLNAGQHYEFVATDTYGDGWCCNHGLGGAKIYAGLSQNNTRLINLDYPFGQAEALEFVAPRIDGQAQAAVAAECSLTAGDGVDVDDGAAADGDLSASPVEEASSSPSVTHSTAPSGSTFPSSTPSFVPSINPSQTPSASPSETLFAGRSSSYNADYSGPTTSESCTIFTIESVFPQIEIDVSKYITYYIQQSLHYDASHCLYNTYPTVWVDLHATNKSGSMNYCNQ